jgi:ribosomal protein L32
MIKCKDCGKMIRASFQQDKVSFEATNFTEQLEKCSNCGKVIAYFKMDYFF